MTNPTADAVFYMLSVYVGHTLYIIIPYIYSGI